MSNSHNHCQVIHSEGMIDLIEEIRLRTWARLNYTEPKNRVCTWPSIVHDEMEAIDCEIDPSNCC